MKKFSFRSLISIFLSLGMFVLFAPLAFAAAPDAPSVITFTAIGGTVVANTLNTTNTNFVVRSTVPAYETPNNRMTLATSSSVGTALFVPPVTATATTTSVTLNPGLTTNVELRALFPVSRTIYTAIASTTGESATSTVNQVITVDYVVPTISATAPTTGTATTTQKVMYTLSEAASNVTITIAQTGGTATDSNSPHTCTMQGTALDIGAHNLTLATNANACVSWANSLVSNAIYTITFNATDVAGNPAVAVTNTGVTYDALAPTMLNSYYVSDTNLVVTMSEPVTSLGAGSGGFSVSETAAPGTTYAVSAVAQGTTTSLVSLTVANMLVSGKEGVTVKYTAGTVTDIPGNALATDSTGVGVPPWDSTAPTLSVTGAVGTTIVGANDTIVLTFSEPVVADDGVWSTNEFDSISTTTGIVLTNAVFSYSGSALTITLNQATDGMFLRNGQTITVDPALNKIKDIAGNSLSGTAVVGTTAVTGDVTAPTVALTYSIDNTTYKDADTVTVTATFNEAMYEHTPPTIAIATAGDGDVTATNMTKTSSTVWTYSWNIPSGADEDGTATITIAGTDLAGNTNATATNNTKILDNTAPTLVSATLDSNVLINVTLSELAAHDTIVAGNDGGFTVTQTGSGITYAVSSINHGATNGTVVLTVAPINEARASGLTITYSSLGNGAVTDVAGNDMATNATGITIPAWSSAAVSTGGSGSVGISYFAPTQTTSTTKLTLPTNSTTADYQALISSLMQRVNALRTQLVSGGQSVGGVGYKFTAGLSLGGKSDSVGKLQSFLTAQGSDIYPSGSVTNYFGMLTQKAVQAFQVKYGLAKSGDAGYGFVGPKTRAKINALQGL